MYTLYIYIQTHTHAYIHTYIHTYIYTYIHTTYINTNFGTCVLHNVVGLFCNALMCRSFIQGAGGLVNLTLFRVAFSFTAYKGRLSNVSNYLFRSSNILIIEIGRVDISVIYLSISKFL